MTLHIITNKLLLTIMLLVIAQIAKAQSSVPENAHINVFGNGWECNRGYRAVSGKCEPVQIPTNAHIDVFGHGWECDRGYRAFGRKCQVVAVPPNAHIDVFGHGWECDRGYRTVGGKCEIVAIPSNAHIDVFGHGWECDTGFKPSGANCIPMTPAEREAQRLLMEAAIARYQAGYRAYDVSGDCDGESVTGTVEGQHGSRDVSGTLEYDNGHEVDFEGEWVGSGEIEGTDEFDNSCDLEVD